MKSIYKLLKYLFILSLFFTFLGIGALFFIYKSLEPELPSIETLQDVRLQVPLRIFSRDGKLIAEYGEKRRIPLEYDQIPDRVRQAFVSAEDDRFYQHPGVDYHALIRAAVQLALTGERRQGGSTITMQVARNFFLSREKTFTRKLKEIFLALRIEQHLSKPEILELYLNKIYLGNRAYGIGAAAQVYYGRSVDELNLAQTAMLAGLPKAPSSINPIANPKKAIERRAYVLSRLQQLGFISSEEQDSANTAPISARVHTTQIELSAPYIAEMVRSEVVDRYGEEAYTLGLNITTTVESRLQEAANKALRNAMQSYDLRHGYRGVLGHIEISSDDKPESLKAAISSFPEIAGLEHGLVLEVGKRTVEVLLQDGDVKTIGWKGLKWARPYISVNSRGSAPKKATDILKKGDLIYLREEEADNDNRFWRLAQVPAVEGAMLAMDPNNGAILALIGGYDFSRSKFNRVIQAHRQPGSGFKAFVYSAALEAGFTPASLVNDAPLVVRNASVAGDWRPENYSGKWFGLTRLRVGLYKSRNLISIRVLRAIGIDFALQHAARFGFDPKKLPGNLTLALGSGEVTPLEMARGYSVFANGGFLIDPFFIDTIEDDKEGVIYKATPKVVCIDCEVNKNPKSKLSDTNNNYHEIEEIQEQKETLGFAPRVLSEENQYIMTSMLKDVIRRGTGTMARSLGRSDLAGKTGTSNEQRDAWFNGFNKNLVAVAWIGFDSFEPLGNKEVGGRVALPAWIDFMKVALDGVDESAWEMPEGIVTVRIDPITGERAESDDENSIFEIFRKENMRLGQDIIGKSSTKTSSDNPQPGSALTQELF